MEDAEPAAEHGLVAGVEAVCEADPRADVVAIGLDQAAPDTGGRRRAACGSRICAPGRQQLADRGGRHEMMAAVGRNEVGVDVVPVDEHADHFIAQPEEQRQPRIQLPVVLREDRPVVREGIHRQIAAGIALLADHVGQAEHEIAEGVAGREAGEGVGPLRLVGAGRVSVLGEVAGVDAAEFDAVRALEPGRGAAQRERRLIEIAEGVLPLIADVGRDGWRRRTGTTGSRALPRPAAESGCRACWRDRPRRSGSCDCGCRRCSRRGTR